jgi:uncharacterized protein YdeI (BOF family)
VVGALVSIKQTGYQTKPTIGGGKVSFENVPVGQIDYNISKEGYQFKDYRQNVSAEIKNNTFRISLQKIPAADDKKILVTGEVNDAEGNDVKDALVEVKIVDVFSTVKTDDGGNYSAYITPNPQFPATFVKIEVKKGDCKKTEKVDLNRTNVIYRDFKLDCTDGKPSSVDGDNTLGGGVKPPVTKGPIDKKSLNGVQLSVDRFDQRGSTATFYFTLENLTAATSIRPTGMYATSAELVDQDGASYVSNYVSIGNGQGSDWVEVKLIYGNPVKCSLQFDVGAVQVKKAAMLKFDLYDYGQIEFVNLSLK